MEHMIGGGGVPPSRDQPFQVNYIASMEHMIGGGGGVPPSRDQPFQVNYIASMEHMIGGGGGEFRPHVTNHFRLTT